MCLSVTRPPPPLYHCKVPVMNIFTEAYTRRGIIVYIEYQSSCPFVGVGSPHPLPRKRVCLIPWTQREGEQHSFGGEGRLDGGIYMTKGGTDTLVLRILCAYTSPSPLSQSFFSQCGRADLSWYLIC
jgi:hypothetical protein